MEDLPIELKIPLPSSSSCSDRDEELGMNTENMPVGTIDPGDRKPDEAKMIEQEEQEDQMQGDSSSRNQTSIMVETAPETVITVAELAHLVRTEDFYQREALSRKARISEMCASCGLRKRLINTSSIAYGNMIDQFKIDDQAGFAGIYEACEQLKASWASISSLNKAAPGLAQSIPPKNTAQRRSPAFNMLQKTDQEVIMAFITKLRKDPGYLADRISALTPGELTALTATYHPPGIDFSILQNHSYGKSQFFSRDSQMMKLSRRMDNLHHFHNQDPFFAIVFGIFDPFAKPGSQEFSRRQEVWSTTCARVMIEGFVGSKPGSDEFTIATLDAFCNHKDWPLLPKFELYFMGLLEKGSFLLEAPSEYSIDFKDSLETHNAKAVVAEADFFDDALTRLVDVLGTTRYRQAVPSKTLSLAHAILQKIDDPKLRLRAQQFIVIRWYFATYISSIVVYPEVSSPRQIVSNRR